MWTAFSSLLVAALIIFEVTIGKIHTGELFSMKKIIETKVCKNIIKNTICYSDFVKK